MTICFGKLPQLRAFMSSNDQELSLQKHHFGKCNISVVKVLCWWLEGCEFKRHCWWCQIKFYFMLWQSWIEFSFWHSVNCKVWGQASGPFLAKRAINTKFKKKIFECHIIVNTIWCIYFCVYFHFLPLMPLLVLYGFADGHVVSFICDWVKLHADVEASIS